MYLNNYIDLSLDNYIDLSLDDSSDDESSKQVGLTIKASEENAKKRKLKKSRENRHLKKLVAIEDDVIFATNRIASRIKANYSFRQYFVMDNISIVEKQIDRKNRKIVRDVKKSVDIKLCVIQIFKKKFNSFNLDVARVIGSYI